MIRQALLLFGCLVGVSEGADAPGFGPYEYIASPSGRFVAIAGIARAEVSPSARMRLRVLVADLVSLRIEQLFTWMKSPWTVVWVSDGTLLVCGRREESEKPEPFVVLVYDFGQDGRFVERPPSDMERAQARSTFDAKHK